MMVKNKKRRAAAGCLMALPGIADLYELYCNLKDIKEGVKEEE